MAAELLKGTQLAEEMVETARLQLARFEELGNAACFTTVLVGEDPASHKYIEMKQREGESLGVKMSRVDLPHDISQADLEKTITELSDSEVDAILIQYPLPKGLDYLRAVSQINPVKDVDGLHPANLGLLFHDPENHPGLLPCTPNGIIQLLEHGGVELENADVAVVGKGLTVGGPLSVMLSAKNNGPSATVATLHHATKSIGDYISNADIVIGAAGAPGIIDASMIKDGATLVAVGVRYVDGMARGDFTKDARDKASIYVPVTGGIGPMTRANLWQNVVRCYNLGHEDTTSEA